MSAAAAAASTARPPRWQVGAAFAAVYVLWGSTYLAIRFAIQNGGSDSSAILMAR